MFTTGDSEEACARRKQEMLAFLQAVDVPLDTSYLRRGSWEWFDDLGQVVALCMTKEPYARCGAQRGGLARLAQSNGEHRDERDEDRGRRRGLVSGDGHAGGLCRIVQGV